jgi:ribosomal protein S20
MIKTISSITLAGLIAATIIGCSKAPEPTIEQQQQEQNGGVFHCKQENVPAPEWTCVPRVEGFYAGVGVAQKSVAGMGFMQRVALANGRSNLAQQIKSQVKDKVETFTRATGAGDKETIDQVLTAVSKQVAKVDLEGSNMVNSWNAPSGALYLLVTVPRSEINTKAKDSIKTSFKSDEALWQQFQSKNALEELDKEFPTE